MGIPLYRVDELRAIEQAAAADLPAGTLMARAGLAAARWISARHERRDTRMVVVCGPGNNGGDGFVVATELCSLGYGAECVLVGAERPSTADAAVAFERFATAGGRIVRTLPESTADVAIDALFGIGLTRPLAGPHRNAAGWINRHRHVYAIDVPSGLDADTGAWVGGVPGVQATATITFIGDKPGLHTSNGRDAAGAVQVEPIGVVPVAAQGHLIDIDDFASLLQPRRHNSHKGTYGNVAVVGGGRGMVGAVLLAARAALRLGAGRVYVNAIGAPELRVDPLQPELMFRDTAHLDDLQVLAVGCGLGVDAVAEAQLASALDREVALVLDADALNLLALRPELRARMAARHPPTILTPHPLEAARLLGVDAAEVQRDRIDAALRLAEQDRCVVLLKGAGTVIARGDGCYAVNPTGSPALATAGTGDVLTGMLAALLAQGFDAWTAAQAAAWLHGRSAEGMGDIGLVAGEVAARAVDVLRSLRVGVSG